MNSPERVSIVWTTYLKYRAKLRGFELDKIDHILRHSTERYFDTVTQRMIVIGRHDNSLVLIPYETKGDEVIPVTIHTTTRQQINFRLKAGRFRHG